MPVASYEISANHTATESITQKLVTTSREETAPFIPHNVCSQLKCDQINLIINKYL